VSGSGICWAISKSAPYSRQVTMPTSHHRRQILHQQNQVRFTHTQTHTQAFYGSLDFVWDNLGEPVPEETFTHLYLLWSSIIPYLLHPSTTIHGILSVQSTRLTVFFHNLSPSFLWSTSWPGTLHFINQKSV